MNQNERLDYLVEKFKADSCEYKDLESGNTTQEKQTVLRSLMNIRMPHSLDEDTVKIQNEYLTERAKEKGIVELNDIPTVKESIRSRHKYADKISIWQGDITRLHVDAIVNAANSQMLGCFVPMHTCIDNCIHSYAGIQLRIACSQYMNQKKIQYGSQYEEPTGQAIITDGYNLPCDHVIHTVGPIVQYNLTDELKQDLKNCYANIMKCCIDNKIRSVAFCCISTGVFRFPNDEAAKIAVEEVTKYLCIHENDFDRVIFNVFKDVDKELYEGQL